MRISRLGPGVPALLLVATVLAGEPPASEGDRFVEVDFARIPRTIAKEPVYVGEPLYALFLFGPRGDVRMWAVLDRSGKDLPYRDVLYLDRDADGDLTEPGERFQGKYEERLARAGMSMTIPVGDLPVPGTDRVHRKLRVSTIPKADRQGIWFSLEWCGRETVSGGAPPAGYDTTRWGSSPETAPVLRPTAEGPLGFALWGGSVLRVGAENSVNFLVGNPGSGPDTLCYVSTTFLDPKADRIVAVLHAKDRQGRARTVPVEMQAPC